MLTTGLWILGFHLDISGLEHLGQILSSSSLLKLREKCPNREYFLVRIFPHSEYLSVFSPNLTYFSLSVIITLLPLLAF